MICLIKFIRNGVNITSFRNKLINLFYKAATGSKKVRNFFILSIGLSLMLWSILHFIKVKGTPVPFNPPPKLVTTGPYSYIRNPMLSGVFILMFGFGIFFRSISLVFIFTPLFVLLNFLELKAIEEPELENRLGKDYSKYKKRVPMFFPKFKKE